MNDIPFEHILFPLTSVFFFHWILRNTLFWVGLWQLKEYRFDRLFIHLFETGQGMRLFFALNGLLKWAAIFLYIPTAFNEQLLLPYQAFITAIYLVESIRFIKEISFGLVVKPEFTLKTIAMVLLSFAFAGVLYMFPILDPFLWLVIIDKILTLFIAFLVFSFSFPTEIHRDMQIEKAVRKFELLRSDPTRKKPLIVIGVTGSYGKSSTKHYMAQVLGQKYTVVSTPGTFNTPIGIARTILAHVTQETDIFIAEMGAYGVGEIKTMCNMVHPKIGVLTAVNEQHLSLFKSLETTMKAKYELIEALPKDGLALFNGTNKFVTSLYKKTKKPKVLYKRFPIVHHDKKLLPELNEKVDIYAYNVITKEKEMSFSVGYKNEMHALHTALLGEHSAENILPAFFLAKYLGMSNREIKHAVSNLSPLPKTLNRFVTSKGITIFDDTYNANPESVLAIVRYMRECKKKKILVFQPMIELGRNAYDEHVRIGREIGAVCDYILLTNTNFYKAITGGIQQSGQKCVVKTGNSKTLAVFLAEITHKGDVVGFEGKEADFTLKQFRAKNQ